MRPPFGIVLFFSLVFSQKLIIQLIPDEFEDTNEEDFAMSTHFGFLSGLSRVCSFSQLEQDTAHTHPLFSFSQNHVFTCSSLQLSFHIEKESVFHGNASSLTELKAHLNQSYPNLLTLALPLASPFPNSKHLTLDSSYFQSTENSFSWISSPEWDVPIFSPAFSTSYTPSRTPISTRFSHKILHIRSTVTDDTAAAIEFVSNHCLSHNVGVVFEICVSCFQARHVLRKALLSSAERAISAELAVEIGQDQVKTVLLYNQEDVDIFTSDGVIVITSNVHHLSLVIRELVEILRARKAGPRKVVWLVVVSSVLQDMQDLSTNEEMMQVLSLPEFTSCWESKACNRLSIAFSHLVPDPRDHSLHLTENFNAASNALARNIVNYTLERENILQERAFAENRLYSEIQNRVSRHSSAALEGYMTALIVTRSIQMLVSHKEKLYPMAVINNIFHYGLTIVDGFRLGPFGSHCGEIGSGCECNQGMRSIRYSFLQIEKNAQEQNTSHNRFLTHAANSTHILVSKPIPRAAIHFAQCGFRFTREYDSDIILAQICSEQGTESLVCRRLRIGLMAAFAAVNSKAGFQSSYVRLVHLDDKGNTTNSTLLSESAIQGKITSDFAYTACRRNTPVYATAFAGIVGEERMKAVSRVSTPSSVAIVGPRVTEESSRIPTNMFHVFLRPSNLEEKQFLLDHLIQEVGVYRIGTVASDDDRGRYNVEQMVGILKEQASSIYASALIASFEPLETQIRKLIHDLQQGDEMYRMGEIQAIVIELDDVATISHAMKAIHNHWPTTRFALLSTVEISDVVAFLKQIAPLESESIVNQTVITQFLPPIPEYGIKIDENFNKSWLESARNTLGAKYVSSLLLLKSQMKIGLRLKRFRQKYGDLMCMMDLPSDSVLELKPNDFVPSFAGFEGYVVGRLLVDAMKRISSDFSSENLLDMIYKSRMFSFGGSKGISFGPFEYPIDDPSKCMGEAKDESEKDCGCNRGTNEMSLMQINSHGEIAQIESTYNKIGETTLFRVSTCGFSLESIQPPCKEDHWNYVLEYCNPTTNSRKIVYRWNKPHPWDQSFSIECRGGSSLPDPFDAPCEYLPYNSVPGIITASICAFGLLCILYMAIGVWKTRRTTVMIAMQYQFLLISLTGSVLGISSNIFHLMEPSPLTCAISPVLSGLGLVLVQASLHVRVLRIYRIFTTEEDSVVLSESYLYRIIIKYLLIMSFLLTIWTLRYGIVVDELTIELPSGHRVTWLHCDNHNLTAINHVMSIVLLYMICYNCYLAFKVRKAPSKFQDSQYLFLSVFTAGLPMIFFGVIVGTIGAQYTTPLVIGFAIVSFVVHVLAISWLVLPKLYEVLYKSKARVGIEVEHPERPEQKPQHKTIEQKLESSHVPGLISPENEQKSNALECEQNIQMCDRKSSNNIDLEEKKYRSPIHPIDHVSKKNKLVID